jgi:hypothetical protein
MPARKPQSTLRSIRIRPDLLDTLTRDAAVKGISVNALVTSILSRYAEWDRFGEKFGLVTITKAGYVAMLDAIPDDALDELAKRNGAQNPRDVALFWFKRLGLDGFLSYLNLISRYGRTFEVETDRQGSEVTLLFHHDLGPKQSRFLLHFMSEAIHAVVGVYPRGQLGRNSVVLKFRAGSAPPTTPD